MSIHGEAMISLVALQIHRDTPSGDDPFWHDQHQVRQSFEARNGKDFKPGSCQEELLSPELTVEIPKSPAIRSAASVAYTKGKQGKTKKTWHISALNDWRFSHGQHPQWWDRVLQTSASPGNTWGPMDQWTDGHLHCISGSPSDSPTALTLLTARSHKSFSAALRAQKRWLRGSRGLFGDLDMSTTWFDVFFLGVRNTWAPQCLKDKTPVLRKSFDCPLNIIVSDLCRFNHWMIIYQKIIAHGWPRKACHLMIISHQ